MSQLETLSCSVCLELLKEPVTVPCGHSYCKTCISKHWDVEEEKEVYSCPKCRQTFTPRPFLMKSTMLAELVEQVKESRRPESAGGSSFATDEDVSCDVCTGRKRKAFKSCLDCVASYCEEHLQPHHQSAAFKRHRLVDPSKNLQENICSRHHEVMKMFCRTDQQCICFLCFVDQHKGHDMVSAAAEHTEKQGELQDRRSDIHKNIQDREKDLQLLEEQLKSIKLSADQTLQNSQQMITDLIRVLHRRSSELEKEVRSKQQIEESAVRELQEKIEQEVSELKKRDAELQQISTTEDHVQFVLSYSSLSELSVSTHSSITHTHPHSCFQELTEQLHTILMEDFTKVCRKVPQPNQVYRTVERLKVPQPNQVYGTVERVKVPQPNQVYRTVERVKVPQPNQVCRTVERVKVPQPNQVCRTVERVKVLQPPEPTSRAGFLHYSQEITLDPNTAYPLLILSEGNRKVTYISKYQHHHDNQDRFTECYPQVLSRESLTGQCYWEVEVKMKVKYYVGVAVSYNSISRDCKFGSDDKSWMLECYTNKYIFTHNKISTEVSGPVSSRIGVYVDHRAGTLSFYSVGDTMTLLHRVNTTFTEPLHAGIYFPPIWLSGLGASAELCKL